MDLEMPIMNGFVATKLIKQNINAPYIVAFTSNEYSQELILKLREANFDDWFTVPVRVQVI
jgi:CheY-like chemotaxis protein